MESLRGFKDYEVIARCVNQYLEHNESRQTVILCDRKISPRRVKPLLNGDVILYDAGVEEFDINIYDINKPRHYKANIAKQRKYLKKWIINGGILLTHDKMFNGCEAEKIVFLAHMWGRGINQYRSGPTRAVSQLCVVSSDYRLKSKQDEIKKHFTVIDQRSPRASEEDEDSSDDEGSGEEEESSESSEFSGFF